MYETRSFADGFCLYQNSAHLKFACGKALDFFQSLRILTDFAASAKFWAELLL